MAARGRPKSFDRETALERAMLVFWDRGFEATGVDDLAGTMGISTSSGSVAKLRWRLENGLNVSGAGHVRVQVSSF